MKPIPFSNIEMRGELAHRAVLNFSRLEGSSYRPDEVFLADQHNWPGDWEGRLILALVLLGRSTHRTPAYLDEIMARVPRHLNERGYFGKIAPEGVLNEQQMAGHSWYLRGLIEYDRLGLDDRAKPLIQNVTKNLVLRAQGFYGRYPLRLDERRACRDWQLSEVHTITEKYADNADTGCAFILLDGVSAAYEHLGSPELEELLEEMADRFFQLDLVGLQVQTHATLTALRGLLRYYEHCRRSSLLDPIRRIFDLYKKEAWTEHYANYNWFGRPRWTEPCAIIDSFILAVSLWKITGEPVYLEDAHHIFYNGMAHGQRENGGFGTDECLGMGGPFMKVNCYEAYWCCTMRGGEGLSRAIEFSYFTQNDAVHVPFYHPSRATLDLSGGCLKLEQRANYPYDDRVTFRVLESSVQHRVSLHLFAPSWSAQGNIRIEVNGQPLPPLLRNGFLEIGKEWAAGDEIEVRLGLATRACPLVSPRHGTTAFTFRHGPALLVCDCQKEIHADPEAVLENLGQGRFRLPGNHSVLYPVCDVTKLAKPDGAVQALFEKG